MSFATGTTSAGSFEPLIRYGPVGACPWLNASQPAGDATNAMNFLAASRFLVVLGMYCPLPGQMVAPALLASSPGIPKKPIFAASSGLSVATGKVSSGYWAALPAESSFMPWSKVVEPADLFSQPFWFASAVFSNPRSATGSVAYLTLFAVYSSAHLGLAVATL